MDDQRYGIHLTEGGFGEGFHALTFSQKELADWIEAELDFPADGSELQLAIPGVEDRYASVGEATSENDRLLSLLTAGPEGELHPWLRRAPETNEHRAVLFISSGALEVYSGLIY